MRNLFSQYGVLQDTFQFQKKSQGLFLVLGGIILSLLEIVGISSVFPLMLVILDPDAAINGKIVGTIYSHFEFTSIQSFALFLAITVIVVFALKVVFNLFLWRYEFKVLNEWRIIISQKIFYRLMQTEFQKINQENSGNYINILTSVIPYITSNYIHQCIKLLQTMSLGVLIVVYMMYVNFLLFIFVCVSGALIIYAFLYFQRTRLRFLGRDSQRLSQDMLEVLQQSIAGFKETKIHQKESFFTQKFSKTSRKLAHVELSLMFTQHLPNILVEFIAILIMFSAFSVLLFLEDSVMASTVQISFVVILGLRMTPLVNRTIVSLSLINSSYEPIGRLLEINAALSLESENWTKCKEQDIESVEFEKYIKLENISFSYVTGDARCLNDISVTIPKNNHIGIVGASGSGKTTLVNIILGFITNYEGTYEIDNIPIKGSAISGMRKITSFVDQQPFLLDSNYLCNIAYGQELDEIDKERVTQCIKDVGLWPHVSKTSEGLETSIGENGKYLSGGQRQRLVIARALYKGSKILVLDEASSALDMESEALLISLLEDLRSSITVISIAHRLSTLKKCDKVIFMEEGRISSQGTFKELYSKNAIFKSYVDHAMIDVD